MSVSKMTERIFVISTIVISGMVYIGTNNPVFAVSNQLESHAISGNDLKNDPMVAKILAEIEFSKKQVAELQKKQKDQEENNRLIAQQRLIAKQLQDQAYQILQMKTAYNSSDNAYSRFLDTIPTNDTKMIFHDQFAFTKQRVNAGHIAMQKVLDNGGTWEEAMQVFSKHAAIKYVEMISVNQVLNDKYLHHNIGNSTAQVIPFDQYGKVPDDYIKVPSVVSSHAS